MIASIMGNTGTKIRFARMDTGQSPQAWVSRMFDEALGTRSDGCDETGCRGFGKMRESPMPVKLSSSSSDKLASLGNSCKFLSGKWRNRARKHRMARVERIATNFTMVLR